MWFEPSVRESLVGGIARELREQGQEGISASQVLQKDFAKLSAIEKTSLLRALFFDLPVQNEKGLGSLLISLVLRPQDLPEATAWLQSVKVFVCEWPRDKFCSNGYSEPQGQVEAQIQVRGDGHSLHEVILSFFHEFTHHLQYQLKQKHQLSGQGKIQDWIVAEGTASFSSFALLEVLRANEGHSFRQEMWSYWILLEKNRIREGPYGNPSGLMAALDRISSRPWSEVFFDLHLQTTKPEPEFLNFLEGILQ